MSLEHLAVFSFKIVCVWKLSFTKLTLKLRQSHRTTEANFTCNWATKVLFSLAKDQHLHAAGNRHGSTPVSTILRKAVRFFIIHCRYIFSIKKTHSKLQGFIQGEWNGTISFRELKSKKFPERACPQTPIVLENCALCLQCSFTKLVSIYPRSASGQSDLVIFQVPFYDQR